MNTSDFDLDLFIKSFEKAGATVIKTDDYGRIIVKGEEKSGYSVLEKFFNNENHRTEMSLLIEGKTQAQRTDFSTTEYTVLAA